MVENSVESNQEVAPVVAPAPQNNAAGISQNELNALVGSAKTKARQQGYEQALKDAAQHNDQANTAQASPVGDTPISANTGTSIPDVEKIVERSLVNYVEKQQEAQKEAQEIAEQQRISAEIAPKIEEAKSRIPDFLEVMNNAALDFDNNTVKFASTVDNSADVLYELAKNPFKLQAIANLRPERAKQEIQLLSKSLKQNAQAGTQPKANKPLDHLKHSPQGVDSSVEHTTDFYTNKYAGTF